jgi:hypothetical protein
MDALDRLEPVARPLLQAVDSALDQLGAPPDHGVWTLLRRVGASPGDAVAGVALLKPECLRPAAAALREKAAGYEAVRVPHDIGWLGHAGDSYAVRASALDQHLRGDGSASLAGRLRTSARYLDDVADWQQRSRDRMARALGDVLTSVQAVTMTRYLGGAGPTLQPGSSRAVTAGADIGVRLLAEAAAALDDGVGVRQRWAGSLAELAFAAPAADGPAPVNATIEMRH